MNDVGRFAKLLTHDRFAVSRRMVTEAGERIVGRAPTGPQSVAQVRTVVNAYKRQEPLPRPALSWWGALCQRWARERWNAAAEMRCTQVLQAATTPEAMQAATVKHVFRTARAAERAFMRAATAGDHEQARIRLQAAFTLYEASFAQLALSDHPHSVKVARRLVDLAWATVGPAPIHDFSLRWLDEEAQWCLPTLTPEASAAQRHAALQRVAEACEYHADIDAELGRHAGAQHFYGLAHLFYHHAAPCHVLPEVTVRVGAQTLLLPAEAPLFLMSSTDAERVAVKRALIPHVAPNEVEIASVPWAMPGLQILAA